MYLDKTVIQKDTCTPMFIAALFKIAKTWKHHKHSSTDERIKMTLYTHTHTHAHTHTHKWNITQPQK